jgi:hypothetical protein
LTLIFCHNVSQFHGISAIKISICLQRQHFFFDRTRLNVCKTFKKRLTQDIWLAWTQRMNVYINNTKSCHLVKSWDILNKKTDIFTDFSEAFSIIGKGQLKRIWVIGLHNHFKYLFFECIYTFCWNGEKDQPKQDENKSTNKFLFFSIDIYKVY